MEGTKICYFHKFNFCKKKDCKYFHPSEVCDEKCDIKTCLKRHPHTSQCMFHTMFKSCKNKDSCKFLHETPQPVEDHSVIFPRGVVHRVENRWGLTKVAAVLLNGLLW